MKQKPKEQIMFESANQFLLASRVLGKSLEDVIQYPPAYITCLLMALELYLKCLIFITTGKRVTGHDPSFLFRKLNHVSQIEIIDLYNKHLDATKLHPRTDKETYIKLINANNALADWTEIEKDEAAEKFAHHDSSFTKDEFTSKLKEIDGLLVDFRYVYEAAYFLHLDIDFVINLCKIVQNKIRIIKEPSSI